MSNPYTEYLEQKGYSKAETRKGPAARREFPCEIHGRRFETREEYEAALHEFLNGN